MSRTTSLTNQQIDQIHQLNNQGKSERVIAQELGLTRGQVQSGLKRVPTAQRQKIAALISGPVAEETRKSVFDIVARLEECLDEIQELMDEDGQLKDRVAVRTEKRMLIAEARATLESIYNIKLLNEFINAVTGILESEAPGARKRIFERLEQSALGFSALALFADGSISGPAGAGAGREREADPGQGLRY